MQSAMTVESLCMGGPINTSKVASVHPARLMMCLHKGASYLADFTTYNSQKVTMLLLCMSSTSDVGKGTGSEVLGEQREEFYSLAVVSEKLFCSCFRCLLVPLYCL